MVAGKEILIFCLDNEITIILISLKLYSQSWTLPLRLLEREEIWSDFSPR